MTSDQPAKGNAATVPVFSGVQSCLIAVLLGLVTLFLYWPATSHDFITYDDHTYVLENSHVTGGLTWQNAAWAFGNGESGNWHPLTWLSHMLDCQLFGLRPWGHHLTNVLLHSVNTGMVFVLFQRLTGARFRSLLVAALFGIHPLHVESVAWVAERKDVLSGLFGLLALYFYGSYAQGRSNPPQRSGAKLFFHSATCKYWLAFIFLALGLMSKSMLVTWPFVMLLLDYWPLKRFERESRRQLIKEKIPFFALAIVVGVVTFLTQRQEGAVAPMDGLPWDARMENALISYGRYLQKFFWPDGLAVFYPYPNHWPMLNVLGAGIFLAGVSGFLIVNRRRLPFLLMGWLWFVGTLVPVIGLVQVGKQSMADRYTYIPLLGFQILIVWGAHELTRHLRFARMTLIGGSLGAIILCFAATRQQLNHWQNSESLFRHALAVTENNTVAHNNLGMTLLANSQFDGAARQFEETIRLNPNDADAHNDLGIALLNNAQLDEAVSQCREAIRLDPNSAEFHINLGASLEAEGHGEEAISCYQEALRLKPAYRLARGHLAVALMKADKISEAVSQYQELLQLNANDAIARKGFGRALFKLGKLDEAVEQFAEAIRLDPNDAETHHALGMAYFKNGKTDEAIRQYESAIRLAPNAADYHNNLGNALGRQGNIDRAIIEYQEAIRLDPNQADAHYNLGVVLFGKGQVDMAIRRFQDAVRLQPDNADAQNNLTYLLELRGKTSAKKNQAEKP